MTVGGESVVLPPRPPPRPKLGVSDNMEGGIRGLRETSIHENISPHIVPIRDSFSLTSFETVNGP